MFGKDQYFYYFCLRSKFSSIFALVLILVFLLFLVQNHSAR